MASFYFDSWWDDMAHGLIVPSTDTYYMMLATSSYTPSKSTHAKRSDITNEVVGTGYTAGGQAVAMTLTPAAGNADEELYNLADTSWAASTITAAYAVVYKHRGGAPSADNLAMLIDFGGSFTSTAGTFTVHLVSQFGLQN